MFSVVRALQAALETKITKNKVMLHPPRVGAHETKAGSECPVFVSIT